MDDYNFSKMTADGRVAARTETLEPSKSGENTQTQEFDEQLSKMTMDEFIAALEEHEQPVNNVFERSKSGGNTRQNKRAAKRPVPYELRSRNNPAAQRSREMHPRRCKDNECAKLKCVLKTLEARRAYLHKKCKE